MSASLIDDAADAIREVGDLLGSSGGKPTALRAGPTKTLSGFMATAWFARSVRLSGAVVALDDEGYGSEFAPLVRSVFEHAMRTNWLAQSKGDDTALKNLSKADEKSRRQRLEILAEHSGDDGAAIVAGWIQQIEDSAIEITDEESVLGHEAGNLKAALESLGLDPLYLNYKTLSAETHPGEETAGFHMKVAEGEQPEISLAPFVQRSYVPDTALYLAIQAIGFADLVVVPPTLVEWTNSTIALFEKQRPSD